MHKRKAKVASHMQEIFEERNCLFENITKLVSELELQISKITNSNATTPKELQDILSLELDTIKLLSDSNFRVESFLTENDLCDSDQDTRNNSEIINDPVGNKTNVPSLPIPVDQIQEPLPIKEPSISTIPEPQDVPIIPSTSHAVDFEVPEKDVNIPNGLTAKPKFMFSDIDTSNVSSSSSDSNNSALRKESTAIAKLTSQGYFKCRIEEDPLPRIPGLELTPTTNERIKSKLSFPSPNQSKKKNKKSKGKTKFVLKNWEVPPEGVDCVFSHIESPREFYLQVVNPNDQSFHKLELQLTEYMQSAEKVTYKTKEEAHASLGKFGVFHTDGWVRCEVINWFLEKKTNEVLVRCVDYGNNKLISYQKLQPLNAEFVALPKQAIRCHLPLLHPVGSDVQNQATIWPTSSIEALVNISGLFSNDWFIFRLVYSALEGDSVAVDLMDVDQQQEATVGQMLLDLGEAVQIITDIDDPNLELEEFLQDLDELENAENINEAITGYDAKDEARICQFTRPDGTCFKKDCKLEHTMLSKDGFTTDQMQVFRDSLNSLTLPSPGNVVDILITKCLDACTFYAQWIRKPFKHEKGYFIDFQINQLIERMNTPQMIHNYKPYKILPAVGEIVVVKHWTHQYLRGVIRELMSNQTGIKSAQVFMVDFGDTFEVSLNNIKKITEDLLDLPFQAFLCYLGNYMSNPKQSLKCVLGFVNKHVHFRNFVAEIQSFNSPFKVSLITEQGENLGRIIMENGFATVRNQDLNPADNCPLSIE